MSIDSVRKWMLKAENDLKVAKDEIATETPVTDAICFHSQQCVEKYLKAFLVYNGAEIPKTHDLAHIIKLCMDIDPAFEELNTSDIISLSFYAVGVRYIDEFHIPSIEEAENAIKLAEKVKQFVLTHLKNLGI